MNSIKVARKELREMFRDRRVRTAMIMPVLMVYLIMQFFGFIGDAAQSATKQSVYIVQSSNPAVAAISGSGMLVKTVKSVEEGEQMIRSGKAGVVLNFGPLPLSADKPQVIEAYFDPQRDTSQIAIGALSQHLEQNAKKSLMATLASHGIPATAAEPVKLEKKEVKVGSSGVGQVVVSILPYLVVLFAFTGGVSLASDLVAGEKEKNTLETLLITPVARTQIVFGKFLALAAVCLLSSSMALVGLLLAGASKTAQHSEMFKGGFGLTPVSALTILLLILPLVALFASILIAISSFARNTREAQTYLALVNVVVILPAVFSQVIGLTDLGTKLWINLVPILNTANNIRNALLGRSELLPIVLTIGESLIFALIALRIAVWLFNREEVLTRV
jgi:sodium transport system permease protein